MSNPPKNSELSKTISAEDFLSDLLIRIEQEKEIDKELFEIVKDQLVDNRDAYQVDEAIRKLEHLAVIRAKEAKAVTKVEETNNE